jgi:four helix bundle protein
MGTRIATFHDLDVYRTALDTAMEVFRLTESFPAGERFAMTDQIRRSSRSVCANLAEAWRRRRYRAAFIAKLNDAESEAAETEVWLELAMKCGYLEFDKYEDLSDRYEKITAQIINMVRDSGKWLIREPKS